MNSIRLIINLLFVAIIFATACKKDEPKSDLDQQKEAISASWEVASATVESDDVAFETPVTITFSTNGTYSIQNLASLDAANLNLDGVLEASGDWEITESNLQLVDLGNGNAVTITELNESSFNFNYSSAYPKASESAKTISIATNKAE